MIFNFCYVALFIMKKIMKAIANWQEYLTPANNNGKCPKCGSKNIGSDNLNWWCNNC